MENIKRNINSVFLSFLLYVDYVLIRINGNNCLSLRQHSFLLAKNTWWWKTHQLIIYLLSNYTHSFADLFSQLFIFSLSHSLIHSSSSVWLFDNVRIHLFLSGNGSCFIMVKYPVFYQNTQIHGFAHILFHPFFLSLSLSPKFLYSTNV